MKSIIVSVDEIAILEELKGFSKRTRVEPQPLERSHQSQWEAIVEAGTSPLGDRDEIIRPVLPEAWPDILPFNLRVQDIDAVKIHSSWFWWVWYVKSPVEAVEGQP